MNRIHLIFPHQLFKETTLFEVNAPIYLVEEFLFFRQYPFHKQKIAFHRATMKAYETFLKAKGLEVCYIEATEVNSDVRKLIPQLRSQGITHINYIDPVDNWLQKRIEAGCRANDMSYTVFGSPLFLNTKKELNSFFGRDRDKYHQTSFYIQQRKQRDILMDALGTPTGGKWTFDTENRKKYPAKKIPPTIRYPDIDAYYTEAKAYTKRNFSNHLGKLTEHALYPTDFESTQTWFQQFLEHRFAEFGPFEDAMVAEHPILNHSVLSPMLNVGLITPGTIVEQSLIYAEKHGIPINSTEGFIRQIIGWREFIRGIYESRGGYGRTRNFWGFTRKIPASFYDGSTGIPPLDQTIKKILDTGYCHHIERLMVLGNFMVLCEFDPDEVYRWFMELFIDAYDWVMVPNVYGMSQFSDGGLMATKPYISGSNYLMKMGNFKKGPWQAIWDGLFWRFMDEHRDFFLSNPRLGMLVRTLDKMPPVKKAAHLENAETYLTNLNL